MRLYDSFKLYTLKRQSSTKYLFTKQNISFVIYYKELNVAFHDNEHGRLVLVRNGLVRNDGDVETTDIKVIHSNIRRLGEQVANFVGHYARRFTHTIVVGGGETYLRIRKQRTNNVLGNVLPEVTGKAHRKPVSEVGHRANGKAKQASTC